MITDEEMRLAIETCMAFLGANWMLQSRKVYLYVGHEEDYLGTLSEVYHFMVRDRHHFATLIRAKNAALQRRIEAYAKNLAQETVDRYKDLVLRTTREEILAKLNKIIQDAPEPEDWTEQQHEDFDTISFVMSWIFYHTKEQEA